MNGYVYLVRAGSIYKIGQSNKPLRRLKEIALDPRPVDNRPELIHIIPASAPRELERRLHRAFSAGRISGEWFALPEEAVDWFRAQTSEPIDIPAFHLLRIDNPYMTFLSSSEVMAALRISRAELRDLMDRGVIRYLRITSQTIRFYGDEVRRLQGVLTNE